MSKLMIPVAGSKRPIMPDAKLLKKSNPRQRIEVSIYLRTSPRPDVKASSKLRTVHQEWPRNRQYLSNNEFSGVFGADQADMDQVVEWAGANGLDVIHRSIVKRRITVSGSISALERVFGVELNEYAHPTGNFRGRTNEIKVPAELYGTIQGVCGLDTRRVGRPLNKQGHLAPVKIEELGVKELGNGRGHSTLPDISGRFSGMFFPPQAAALYNYPADLDGTGQNVAIFAFNGPPNADQLGGYDPVALQNYFEKTLGGKMPPIDQVVVKGSGNTLGLDTPAASAMGDSTSEIMLDLCVMGSVSPGAHIFVYFTEPTSRGWVDAIQDAITDDNKISVISISYGYDENDQGAWSRMEVQLINELLQGAAAKGITVCCASGDSGSANQEQQGIHVDFPASSPFVLSVGGTKLVATSEKPPTIESETVWNDQSGASGGGVSSIFAKPDYQAGIGVPPSMNPPYRIGRGVPDVAALADLATGIVVAGIDGKTLKRIGGTSVSAPMWAALIARLNQGLNARCGFLNPLLYSQAAVGVLRDITSGDNGTYEARQGWDACTGLGSPDGQKLLQCLSGSFNRLVTRTTGSTCTCNPAQVREPRFPGGTRMTCACGCEGQTANGPSC